jgi:hypothetical protein
MLRLEIQESTMLSLGKVDVHLYATYVMVKATCEYNGETWERCTASIKANAFKKELQPMKDDIPALKERAIELAKPKFISQLDKKLAKRKQSDVDATPAPSKRRAIITPKTFNPSTFKPAHTPTGSRQGGASEFSPETGLKPRDTDTKMSDLEQENSKLKQQVRSLLSACVTC